MYLVLAILIVVLASWLVDRAGVFSTTIRRLGFLVFIWAVLACLWLYLTDWSLAVSSFGLMLTAVVLIDEVRGRLKDSSIPSHSLDKRIQRLIVGHLLATAVLATASFSLSPRFGLLSSLSGSQVTLLGIWAGLLTTTTWQARLGAIVVGTVYGVLASTLQYFIQVSSVTSAGLLDFAYYWGQLLVLIPTYAVFVSLRITAITLTLQLLQRIWKIRISRCQSHIPAPTTDRVQFSILHLMVLTASVGVVIGIGTYVHQALGTNPLRNVMMLYGVSIAIMIITSIPNALLAVWATLTLPRPTFRIVSAVILSLFIGLVQPIVFSRFGGFSYLALALAPLNAAGKMFVVIISLLVFRQCGFRLTHKSS